MRKQRFKPYYGNLLPRKSGEDSQNTAPKVNMRIKTECLNLFQIISFQLNLAIKNHGMSNTFEPPTENTYISHKITTRTKKASAENTII